MALKFGQSGKGRSNPRQYGTKKLPPTICRKLLLGPQYKLGDQSVKAGKIASSKVSLLASWIADKYWNRQEASQEIKRMSMTEILRIKTTERKFNPRTVLKKNLSEDSKLNENWNISIKLKRKKILKFKELCYSDILSDKLITLKFAILYLFYPFLVSFVQNSFLKTLLFVLSFWNSNRTRKLRNLPFKMTL